MRQWIATALMATTLVGLIPGIALAGSRGRKNTAIGLTGAAAFGWLNGGFKSAGRRNTAIALTGASVVAWHKYKKAKRAERRRARLARSHSSYGYGRSYGSSYYVPVSYGGRSYRGNSGRAYQRNLHTRYGPGVRAEL